MDNLPVYSIDLVKALDNMYPNRLPILGTTQEELAYLIGQRSVVDFLLSVINEDHEGLPQVLAKD